jgi:hypothetical protein
VRLTIDRLVTRGKIPRQLKVDSALIERVARDQFPAECGRQLSRPWPIQPPVARIRKLRVRLTIPAAELRPDTLAAAWTAAFIRELFATLAHPNGVEIVLFASRAEYAAAAIRDLLDGVATRRWAFEEFEPLFDLGKAEAALALFDKECLEIVPILFFLEDRGDLDRLLVIWGQAALERFFLVIARAIGASDGRPTIQDLITVAQLLLDRPSLVRETLLRQIDQHLDAHPSRERLALKLFLGLARQSDWRSARIASPQIISHAVRILSALLDLHKSAAIAESRLPRDTTGRPVDSIVSGLAASICSILVAAGAENRSVSSELWEKVSSIARFRAGENLLIEFRNILTTANPESRTALASLFEQLASMTVGTSLDSTSESKRISTDWAGLFFLVRIIDKLGWENRLVRSSLGTKWGPRLLTYILAGTALAIVNRFNDEPRCLDSGLALFSGWVDQPDLHGLRDFFASGTVETRRGILRELLDEQAAEQSSITWQSGFDLLAAHLIRELTGRIRCLGKASRSFVVKNFVTLPGRIRIEEKRLVVVFTSSPLNAVVHLSGLDDSVEEVDWLGGRRIEFEPYAL